MIRPDRSGLTRKEIIRLAANRFLNEGYSKTSIHSMCKALRMSTGNLTFHFPTKEHLLTELVDMLCNFQWHRMEEEAEEGNSSLLALCLELMSIAAACEQDEVAKDFFLSTYRSQMSMELIRSNDKKRAKEVFKEYCPDWTEEQFVMAELLIMGIEYSTITSNQGILPLKTRIEGALNQILSIYNIDEETRKIEIEKVLQMDCRSIGKRVLSEFVKYVEETNNHTLEEASRIHRRKMV